MTKIKIGLVGSEICLSRSDVDGGRFLGGQLDLICSLLPNPGEQMGEIIMYCHNTGRYVELDENNYPIFW